MQKTAILGVTGPVAAGKSALSRRLAALGARLVDVDGLGHEALASPAAQAAVLAAFGTIDKRALARRVFGDVAARRRLEGIVHPIVRTRIDEEIAAARAAGAALVVLDCALLFESGLDALCDATVVVDAPDALRFARARAAHGWDEAEVRRRDAAQLPAAEKRARAGRTVVNDGDESRLDRAATDIHQSLAGGATVVAGRRTSS
jgi:dephospho-CoA kinase